MNNLENGFDKKAAEWDQQVSRVRRAREVAGKIKERVALGPQVHALDFGCGTGLLGMELAPGVGRITFADTSSGMLAQVDAKIAEGGLGHARTLNLTQTALAGSFDLIVSLMVLHHIDDVASQIAALAHCLSPGGVLCLADLDAEDGSFHAPDTVPHNGFLRQDIERWMIASGLTDVEACTAFVNKKVVGAAEKEYPVFLVTGRRH